ncbi:MAG: hypothetical protein HN348_19240, partial [Proteobacteria bacterium]|nr:hypothetical protein [Pseudomonadota bacterium]
MLLSAHLLLPDTAMAQEGYYKDLFIDGGHDLTSRTELYAGNYLGLTYDALATDDEDLQYETMISSSDDTNGALLYPDGAPRYRVIYTAGGSSTGHGRSLGEEGRDRVRDFFYGGGSYTGSCAGAFLSMIHRTIDEYDEGGPWENYYHLWPGIGRPSYVLDAYHDIFFDDTTHPLVAMYPSLQDGWVSTVRHNGGCRFDPNYFENPVETEYIGIMDSPSLSGLDGYYNMMAYKESAETGRVVVTCSHPEGVTDGEQRDMMAAILQYALDGQGTPWAPKGTLENGSSQLIIDDAALLGDYQYHYWKVDFPQYVQ